MDMATKKRLANRFKAEYAKGSKKQKGEVLDRLVAVGMGRSTARPAPKPEKTSWLKGAGDVLLDSSLIPSPPIMP